jgi:hypothetical protein
MFQPVIVTEVAGPHQKCEECGLRLFDGSASMAAKYKLAEFCAESIFDLLLVLMLRDDPERLLAKIEMAKIIV